MVRAIDNCVWRNVPFLERVRPGLAISILLHVTLLLALAYYLAFHTPLPPRTEDPVREIIVVTIPKTEPAPLRPVEPLIRPKHIERVEGLHSKIEPLVLPPVSPQTETTLRTTVTANTPPTPTIIDARAIDRGGLVYPERALDAGQAGYVDFTFTIEPDGSVGNLKMVEEVPSGYGFAAAAEKAFPKWRFEPKLVDGKPVPAPARYRVSFLLK
jgi:protein TonB